MEHEYLTPELGARVVRDAQTINLALGYEMNTIEFAIKDGVPYAIDFLNPACDFERDRITPFYFDIVVERMARLVIDRAHARRSPPCRGRGGRRCSAWAPRGGFIGAPRPGRPSRRCELIAPASPADAWNGLLRPEVELAEPFWAELSARLRAAKLTFGGRVHCPFLRPFFLVARGCAARRSRRGDDRRRSASASCRLRWRITRCSTPSA